MNKINNKGQGALEYLLLIGGAVLIAVIVIALLIGLGSQNAEDTRAKNEDAQAASNLPVASVINTVTCNTNKHFIINWTPVHKEGNTYKLIIDNTTEDKVTITTTTNPIISVDTNCIKGKSVTIKTTNNGISVLSNTVTVE